MPALNQLRALDTPGSLLLAGYPQLQSVVRATIFTFVLFCFHRDGHTASLFPYLGGRHCFDRTVGGVGLGLGLGLDIGIGRRSLSTENAMHLNTTRNHLPYPP